MRAPVGQDGASSLATIAILDNKRSAGADACARNEIMKQDSKWCRRGWRFMVVMLVIQRIHNVLGAV